MSLQRAAQIVLMVALPFLAVYVVAPAARTRLPPHGMFWAEVGLIAFGILLLTLARLLPARNPRS